MSKNNVGFLGFVVESLRIVFKDMLWTNLSPKDDNATYALMEYRFESTNNQTNILGNTTKISKNSKNKKLNF